MSTPNTIAYFNGQTLALDDVKISADDRGYLFGDAVYEVVRIYDGKPFLLAEHLERLARSLKELEINFDASIQKIISDNIANNKISEGYTYLQISRGTAPRAHSFHNLECQANILLYSKHFHQHPSKRYIETGMKAITLPDLRWGRCDIKTVNLLPNSMAQTKAAQVGAGEAILIDNNNHANECTASNIFMVKDKIVYTPPLTCNILPGTVRGLLLKLFAQAGVDCQEKVITKDELFCADELFVTSSTKEALAIVELEGKVIGDGSVGPAVQQARRLIMNAARPVASLYQK